MTEPKSSLSFSTWRKIAMTPWRPRKDSTIWATVDIEAPRMRSASKASLSGSVRPPTHPLDPQGAKR